MLGNYETLCIKLMRSFRDETFSPVNFSLESLKLLINFLVKLTGDLKGKKFGFVTEGSQQASAGVKSVIDEIVGKMRGAGVIVDVISLPEHLKGICSLI